MTEVSESLLKGESGGGSVTSLTLTDSSMLSYSPLKNESKNSHEADGEETSLNETLPSSSHIDTSTASLTLTCSEGGEKSMRVGSDVQWPLSEGLDTRTLTSLH